MQPEIEGKAWSRTLGKVRGALNDRPKDIFAARQGMQLGRGSFAKVNHKKQ